MSLGRALGALCGGLVGVAFLFAAVIGMNAGELAPPDAETGTAIDAAAPPPRPPPVAAPPPPRPRPKAAPRAAAAPLPGLGASLAGLDFGLAGLSPGELGAEADALIGARDEVVMTAATVDAPPRPVSQVPPRWPEAARRRGLNGRVTVRLKVRADGSPDEVEVLEAEPPGVFDAAALEAVRQWRFEPATYEGRAVAVRVTLPLVFAMEAG